MLFVFFSSRRRHTRYWRDWSSDVCSSDLGEVREVPASTAHRLRHLPRERPERERALHEEQRLHGPHRRSRRRARTADGGGRKSVVLGKSGDLGGRRIVKKQKDV